MTFKDRVGLVSFMLAVSGAAMALSVIVDYLARSFDLIGRGPIYVMISAAICALPIAWFVGTRLVAICRLKDQIEITSRHDSLTGLLNRSTFLDLVAEQPSRRGAVAILDLDFFKTINDTHGHFIGDEVLAHVARVMLATCRRDDLICRFGGEEFAILFSGATPEVAKTLAMALVDNMASDPVFAGGQHHHLTVSIGYAMHDGATDPAQALQAADQALYRAKAQGRNRAVAAWDAAPIRILPAA